MVLLASDLTAEVGGVERLAQHGLVHLAQLGEGELGVEEGVRDRRVGDLGPQAAERVLDDAVVVERQRRAPRRPRTTRRSRRPPRGPPRRDAPAPSRRSRRPGRPATGRSRRRSTAARGSWGEPGGAFQGVRADAGEVLVRLQRAAGQRPLRLRTARGCVGRAGATACRAGASGAAGARRSTVETASETRWSTCSWSGSRPASSRDLGSK